MAQVEQRLVFVISARDENVSRVVKAVQTALAGAGKEAASSGNKMRTAWADAGRQVGASLAGLRESVFSLRTAFVALGAGAGLKSAASSALEFDRGMRLVGTIVDDVAKDLPLLEKRIRDVAVAFGQDQGKVVRAQLDIIGSGFFEAADAAKVMGASVRLAVAGGSDVEATGRMMVRTLKGFGLSADEAAHAADVLFQNVKYGISTVEELSEHFAIIGPQARLAGVSFEETNAALAALTAGGIPTAEAITALNRLFSGMAAPTEEAGMALKATGIQITKIGEDGREQLLPLLDVVEQFRGLDLATIEKFFPNVRAVKALGVLVGNFEEFRRNYELFLDTAKTGGSVDDALAIAGDGPAIAIDRLKSAVKDLAIEFGSGFTGVLGDGAEEVVANLDRLREVAKQAGLDFGEALRSGVRVLREWGPELKALLAAWVALRSAMVIAGVVQQIQAIAVLTRRAAAATAAWAAQMRAAGTASLGLKAGIAGAALAVGLLVAQPLGEWLGEALSGAEELSAELARVQENSRAAAEEFERQFMGKVGVSASAAADQVASGSAVLVENIRMVNRATGEEIDSAEELTSAQAALGAGKEVLSARLIDVSAAAQSAAAAYLSAGAGAVALDSQSQRMAEQMGVSAEVIARLPQEVRDAFAAASAEMTTAAADLSEFKRQAEDAARALDLATMSRDRDGIASAQRQLSFLSGAVASAEKAAEQSARKQQGISQSIAAGVMAEAQLRADAAERERLRQRQLAMRKQLDGEQDAERVREEADRLSEARRKAFEEYVKLTQSETGALVAGLKDRLDAVKAYAADAAAAQARAAVMGSFRVEFTEAAEGQLRDAAEAASDAVGDILSAAGERASLALEDGLRLRAVVPDLGAAVSAASAQFARLRATATDTAEAVKADLLSVVEEEGRQLVAAGLATEDEIAAIMKDPLDSERWRASALMAGESLEDLEGRLGDFAVAVADSRARAADLDAEFSEMARTAEAEASSAVRELVSGLGELDLRQLRLVRSTLDANDALQASALRLVDARIRVAELAAQQEKLDRSARDYAAGLSGQDFGVGSLRTLGGVLEVLRSRGVPALEVLRGELFRIRDQALSAAAAGEELASAFSAASGRVSEAGLFQLARLRAEARAAAKELAAAASAAADKAAASGDPADLASAEALSSAADAAAALGADAGAAFLDRVGEGAAAVGAALGQAALAAGQALYGLVRDIVEMAADPEAVDTFINEVISAIPRIVENLAGNIDVLLSAIAEAVPEIVGSLVEALPEIVDALLEGLEKVARSLIENLPELIEGLLLGLADFAAGISDLVRDLLPQLVEGMKGVFSALGEVIPDIVRSTTEIIPDVVDAVIELLMDGLPKIVSGIMESLPDLITNVLAGVSQLVRGIGSLLAETLPVLIQEIISAIPEIITALLAAVGDIVDALVVGVVAKLPDIVIGIVEAVLEGIPEIVVALVEGVVNLIGSVATSLIVALIELVPELFVALVAELPLLVAELTLELLAALPRIVGAILGGIASSIFMLFNPEFWRAVGEGLWASLKEAFAGLTDVWEGVVGAWEDLAAWFEGVAQWVSDLWESVKAWFADLFRIGKGDGTGRDGEDDSWIEDAGENVAGAFSDAGEWFGGLFQHGGVVQPRSRRVPVAQFGTVLPGLGNGPMPVLAHAGEGFLQKPAVRFVGGEAGVGALNRGLVPDALRGSRDSSPGGGGTVVNFQGAVFARDASRVVDDMTSRSYRTGTGRTSALLRKKYGTMPGQRS